MGSVLGTTGGPSSPHYSAAKAAIFPPAEKQSLWQPPFDEEENAINYFWCCYGPRKKS